MTTDEYLADLERLIATANYASIVALAEREYPHLRGKLTAEQIDYQAGMLEQAHMALKAQAWAEQQKVSASA